MKQNNTSKKRSGMPRLLILLALALFLIAYLTVPAVSRPINQAAAVLGFRQRGCGGEYHPVLRRLRHGIFLLPHGVLVGGCAAARLSSSPCPTPPSSAGGREPILSWSSAMAGAALCFFISRGLGRDVVERFAGKGALASVESYFEKYGSRTVLVCRLLPFVSFDAVSYFAGLTPIRFTAFFVATGIGQLPATVVYSYVGGMLTGGVKYLVTGLLCIFSLGILGTIFKQLYNDRQVKKAGNTHE